MFSPQALYSVGVSQKLNEPSKDPKKGLGFLGSKQQGLDGGFTVVFRYTEESKKRLLSQK